MGLRKFKGQEQGQKTQAMEKCRLPFMPLCVEVGRSSLLVRPASQVGRTVPGRPRTGRDAGPYLAGPQFTIPQPLTATPSWFASPFLCAIP